MRTLFSGIYLCLLVMATLVLAGNLSKNSAQIAKSEQEAVSAITPSMKKVMFEMKQLSRH